MKNVTGRRGMGKNARTITRRVAKKSPGGWNKNVTNKKKSKSLMSIIIYIFGSANSEVICYYTKQPPVRWFLYIENQKIISNINFFLLSDYSSIRIRRKTWDSFTLRGSSVPSKPMEPRFTTTCSVYLWTGVKKFPYLRREWLTISNISFIHKVHEDLVQVFIDLIGLLDWRIWLSLRIGDADKWLK